MNKSINFKTVLALTAAVAAISLTGCDNEDDISISNNTDTSIAEVTVASTEEVTEATAAETKITETEETKSNITSDNLNDEEYKKELLDIFVKNIDIYNKALYLITDYGIEVNSEADDILWVDTDTRETICSDGKECSDTEIDYEKHPHAAAAYPLKDERFSNLDEYNEYLNTIFTKKFLDSTECGRFRFFENNGKVYIIEVCKGLLFDNWHTDKAEITEFEKDKSFTVFVLGREAEDPDNNYYGTIKFVKESDGWKIDELDYKTK